MKYYPLDQYGKRVYIEHNMSQKRMGRMYKHWCWVSGQVSAEAFVEWLNSRPTSRLFGRKANVMEVGLDA